MKYYLLSKVFHFDRFFDSVEEVGEYVQAMTGIQFFDIEFVKEYLKDNNNYSYSYRGIDIIIFKRKSVEKETGIHTAHKSTNI